MSDDSLIGKQLDEYRLETLLGKGGMARVYRALDVRLKRYAAVKVIDTPYQENDDYLMRFEREAQAIARLDHPHIVSVYRYGQADGLLYLAMKYIEGSDLHSILSQYEQTGELMPWADATRIITEVASALDYAHEQGVIHRDVKPSNIMLDGNGRSYLTDFGLVLLENVGTRGEILGTPHYLAPEQAMSSAGAGPLSDLYAVGVILYRMVTGQLPFQGDNLMDVIMQHMTDTPPLPRQIRPDISPALETVLLRALAKEPAERYANGKALVAALHQAQERQTVISPTMPSMTLAQRVMLDTDTLPPPPVSTKPVAAVTPEAADATETAPTTVSQPQISSKQIGIGAIVVVGLLLLAFAAFRGRIRPTNTMIDMTPEETAVIVETAVATDTFVSAITDPADSEPTITAATSAAAPITPTSPTAETAVPPTTIPTSGKLDTVAAYLPIVAIASASNPVPTATTAAVPTTTPQTATDAVIILERQTDTLYLTYQGNTPLLLQNLTIANEKGDQQLSEWPQTTLIDSTCFFISKKAKDANDKIEGTSCQQLVGALILFDWKEDFRVLWQGTEIGACHLKGKENRCTVTLPSG